MQIAEIWELKPHSEIKNLQMITAGYGMRISDIEDKLSTLERITKESMQNIKSWETKFYQKIETMELKLSELQNKTFFKTQNGKTIDEEIRKVKTIYNNEGHDTDSVMLKTNFNYDIRSKKFHMLKRNKCM